MKASSGRIGQYKILKTVGSLCKHLLETELLSEASLFKFLGKYKTIVIKPVFGPDEIFISHENAKFEIRSGAKITTVMNKEEIYPHLICNEITQNYYIIQPRWINSGFIKSHFQSFITVHRKSASSEWYLKSKAEKYSSVFGRFFYKLFLQKIKKLSIVVAKKLGESFPGCNSIVIDIGYNQKGNIWIQDTALHFPKSKWSQYLILTDKSTLDTYLPDTDLFSQVTFNDFLNRYHKVIIKPCFGKEGLGIVQISSNNHLSYEIHTGRKKFTKSSLEETYQFIEEHYLSKKYYLVQQKINLAMINDCPMDVRVIAQKVDSNWKITGKIVKVAENDFFITNVAQKLLSLEDAIRYLNISNLNNDTLESKIDEICISAAGQLEADMKEINMIGFDIGITDQGNLWIIEGNYNPNLSMFYMLEDKKIYMKMLKAKRK
ncbi:YheC/YheD family protein [Neobacillus novalis]|uniref:YheC/YheD family protein n=1 Tax=Neobacillus novalis TaxID=220687 RepID=A0AA95SA73_9BACI|nr:YheC/YheD family protein [Neobacillus novalis]WHY85497.1 YheC/YheD family protein [Neobacillus novalis]